MPMQMLPPAMSSFSWPFAVVGALGVLVRFVLLYRRDGLNHAREMHHAETERRRADVDLYRAKTERLIVLGNLQGNAEAFAQTRSKPQSPANDQEPVQPLPS